jgi:hypothetical protein
VESGTAVKPVRNGPRVAQLSVSDRVLARLPGRGRGCHRGRGQDVGSSLVVVGSSALFVTGVVREYGMFRNVQDVVLFVGVPVAITGGLVWSWWRLWRPRDREHSTRRLLAAWVAPANGRAAATANVRSARSRLSLGDRQQTRAQPGEPRRVCP